MRQLAILYYYALYYIPRYFVTGLDWIAGTWAYRRIRGKSRHLWERLMSTNWKKVIRRRRTRKKQVQEILDRRISQVVEEMVEKKVLKKYEADQFYAIMADAGFHDLGYDPRPNIDGLAFGKPFWKTPSIPNPRHLKNQIVGRLTQAKDFVALGKLHRVWTDQGIAKFLDEKEEERKTNKPVKVTAERKVPSFVVFNKS